MVQASVHARLLHTVEQKALFYIFSKSRFTGVIRLGFAVLSSCSYFCENTSTTRVMSLMPRYWPGYWNCCKSWASSAHMRSKPRQLWCGCHHFHDPRNAWLDAPRWGVRANWCSMLNHFLCHFLDYMDETDMDVASFQLNLLLK